jgi:hypothetical protein
VGRKGVGVGRRKEKGKGKKKEKKATFFVGPFFLYVWWSFSY